MPQDLREGQRKLCRSENASEPVTWRLQPSTYECDTEVLFNRRGWGLTRDGEALRSYARGGASGRECPPASRSFMKSGLFATRLSLRRRCERLVEMTPERPATARPVLYPRGPETERIYGTDGAVLRSSRRSLRHKSERMLAPARRLRLHSTRRRAGLCPALVNQILPSRLTGLHDPGTLKPLRVSTAFSTSAAAQAAAFFLRPCRCRRDRGRQAWTDADHRVTD